MRNWGSGQPADLGSLEVESFTPGADGASVKGDPKERAGGATPAREPLFHEQLARRLAQLEVRLPARFFRIRLPKPERELKWGNISQAAWGCAARHGVAAHAQ